MQRFEEPVQNLRGDVLTLCPMQVLVAGTNTPATIFADAAGQTVITSPSTDKTGTFAFYAPNGRYDIYAIVNGQRLGHKLDYLLDDPVDDNTSQTAAIAAAQSTASGAQTAAAAAQADANALQLADYAALRAYTGPRQSVYVTGYLVSATPTGIAGMFVRDDSDTTSADNGGTVIVAGNGKRWKRQFSGVTLIDWFGTKGDGTTDDTTAVAAAFAFALATTKKLNGYSASNYRVSAKIAITSGNFDFDGCNCLFTNAVSNATAADSFFEMASTSISNVRLVGFRVAGTSNNGHIIGVLGALSAGPQFVTLERIWVQNNTGNGKDHNGNPIPAQLLYAYGGMTIKLRQCVTYLSGGVYADSTLKLHLSGCTIDSPPAGRLLYLKACNQVLVDAACVFNGGTTDQIEADSCNGVTIQTNRLKGGSGRQFYAHGPSTAIAFEKNQHEVYALTSNAVEITTAVAAPRAVGNTLAFVNGSGSPATFTKSGIALIDEPGGGFISSGAVIDGNGFIVNSLMTIASLISVGSTLNSVRSARISSNVLAAPGGGSSSTITKGIDLSGTAIGVTIENNQYGATSGNTMATGISVGSSCTGTRLLENVNFGNCTTPISDAGFRTTRTEGGALASTSYAPVVSGLSTAGTATYTNQTGTYTRNGNLVKVDIAVAWTGHTGTGNLAVSIPFYGVAGKFQVISVLSDSLAYTGQLRAAVNGGDNFVRLWMDTAGAAASPVTMDAAATLYISGVVETA